MKHYEVLIIGGGTAGIMVSAQLRRKDKKISIGLIEPSDKHYYQPAWTLVGAGDYSFAKTIKNERDFIPPNVDWIQDFAVSIDPDNRNVGTEQSGSFTYDYLVVAPGLVMAPELLPGLTEALDTGVVCSNYTDPEHTWEVLKNFKGGNAIFTQPATPIKCGGAPQKIMYMAEEYFRKKKIRDKTNVVFATPGTTIFGVKEFAKTLNKIIIDREIILKTHYVPVKIDSENRYIHFRYAQALDDNCAMIRDERLGEEIIGDTDIKVKYDMLHLAPPQAAPEFIRNSPVSMQEGPNKGWVDVDVNTLRHKRFPNIFSLGDVAALPTAKTGAAIRKQAPVVVENILHSIRKKGAQPAEYNGYSSCPLVTGYSKMVLAEFKYDNIRDSDPVLSKLVDTTKEQTTMYWLKKYGLPVLYWNFMLKGRM